jgi:hypothetical protein
MSKQLLMNGLLVSSLALGLAGPLAAGAQAEPQASGMVSAAAQQLAARGDGFAASSASLEVLPIKMAGSCPRAYMLKIDLGAEAPGKLAYRIETLDGRASQVFEAPVRAHREGGFVAQAQHEIVLRDGEAEADSPSRLVFSAPTHVSQPDYEPDFFERLFGTAQNDPTQGLSQQSFRVKVVAPNEVASTFDAPSVSCEYNEMLRVVDEDQRDDGRDRPRARPRRSWRLRRQRRQRRRQRSGRHALTAKRPNCEKPRARPGGGPFSCTPP